MAIGDIFELKHVQRDYDQKHIENVYFYRQDSDPSGGPYSTQSQRLANDWLLDVWPVIQPSIPSEYKTAEIRVRNLFNPADMYIMPVNLAGSRSHAGTEYQPSFLAGVVTLATNNGLVQKGRKMLAGLLESDQSAGIFTVLGITFMAVRAAAVLIGISTLLGGQKAFVPVVVKRVREGTPGNYTYRLPTNQIEAIYGEITSAVVSAIVSSQDTRKT